MSVYSIQTRISMASHGLMNFLTYIPGLNVYRGNHSACLVKDGTLVAAAEEEQLRRIKHSAGFPLAKRPDLGLAIDRIKNTKVRANVTDELNRTFPDQHFVGKLNEVEHRPARLGSAFLVSLFDDAVVVSMNGFSNFASAAWAII